MYDGGSTPNRMRVLPAIQMAIDHTKRVLFRDASFNKWLCFGVIIFLSQLAEGGHGFSFNFQGGRGDANWHDFDQALSWLRENLPLVLGIGIPVLCLVIALGVFLLWAGSRGHMMLIRAVALNDERIGEAWHATRASGNSLFLFRLVLGLAAFLYFGVFVVIAILVLSSKPWEDGGDVSSIMFTLYELLPLLLVAVAGGIVFAVVSALLGNFVTPIMYHFNMSCTAAWGLFRTVSRGNAGPITGFLLLKIVYAFVSGIIVLAGMLLTCCIGILPVVHHTLFSPLYVFGRSFSLCALESLGPQFVIIRPAQPPAIPPTETSDNYPPEQPPESQNPPAGQAPRRDDDAGWDV